MNRKVVILIIVTFLAMLFLSTVGGIFTGFVTYKGGDIDLSDYPFPFIKNGCNKILIITPDKPTATEALAANKIAQSLKSYSKQSSCSRTVTYKWYNARYSLENQAHNLILIGKKDNNKIISKVLAKNPEIIISNNPGNGNIIIFNNKDRFIKLSTIVVTSNSDKGIEKAANVLSNFKNYPLIETSVTISGEKGYYNLGYK